MNAKELEELLSKEQLNACTEAKEWAKGKTLQEVWKTCHRGDWMLWIAREMQGKEGWHTLRQITLAKALCAKLVVHLMADERSKKAVEVAEQFGLGKATREELDSAAIAAYTVAADDDAAYTVAADDDAAYTVAAAAAAATAAYTAAAAAYTYAYTVASAAAAAAAYTYAAAIESYNAAAASKKATILEQCANICREHLPIN